MTIKCYDKPWRSKPREFRQSDLERIARYVEKTGVPYWKIIAGVAGAIGAGALLCKAVSVMKSLATIAAYLKRFAGLLATLGIIRVFLARVILTPARLIPLFTVIVGLVLVVLFFIEKVYDAIVTTVKDATFIDEVVHAGDLACGYVVEKFGVAVEAVEDIDLPDVDIPDLPDLDDIEDALGG